MTVSVKHAKTSAKVDGSDATLIQPSDWNAEHTLTLAPDKVLGRASAGAGAVEEITCTAAGRALLDDADAAAQRTTLGLGNAATKNTGTAAGTVAAGDDSRITGAAQKSANLSDLADAPTARANLGLGSAATKATGTSGAAVPLLDGNNTHSGANTFTQNITAPNVPKAFGKVINYALQSGANVASVADIGGYTRVTFSSPMPDANYIVLITIHSSNGVVAVYSQTTTYFELRHYNYATPGYGSTPSFHFVVLSNT